MRSRSWLSLLGFSVTLWLGTADDRSVTARIGFDHGSATDAAGVAQADGREHGQVVQADARVEHHGVGGAQYLGESIVAEAEAGDVGEEDLRIVRPRALEAASLDGFVADTGQAVHLSAITHEEVVGIYVRSDGTLGREGVSDGGVVDHTEGSLGAAEEDHKRTVEIDEHHGVGGMQYLGESNVAEAEAGDVGEEDLWIVRPRALGADSLDGFVADTGQATHLSATTNEEVVDNRGIARPHLADAATAEDVLMRLAPAPVVVGTAPQAIPAAVAVAPPVVVAAPNPGAQAVTAANPVAQAATEVPTEAPRSDALLIGLIILVLSLVGCGICIISFLILKSQKEGQKSHDSPRSPPPKHTGTSSEPPRGAPRAAPLTDYRPLSFVMTQEQQRKRANSMARAQTVLERHGSKGPEDARAPTQAQIDLGGDASAGAPIGRNVNAGLFADTLPETGVESSSDSGASLEAAIERDRQRAANLASARRAGSPSRGVPSGDAAGAYRVRSPSP